MGSGGRGKVLKRINILSILLLGAGFFCFAYFFAIISYAGRKTDFLWFWAAAGTACILAAFIFPYIYNNYIALNQYFRIIFFALIILGISVFLFVEGRIIYTGNSRPEHDVKYVIILGAQVKGTRVSRALKNRLDTAESYLRKNPETLVIVSGGQGRGEDISEALAMKNYLCGKGIKGSRILMEDRSTSTATNIRFSQSIMGSKDQPTAIVTNKFHVYRAVMLAKKQGMTRVEGLGAPTSDILLLHYYVREFFAVLKDSY